MPPAPLHLGFAHAGLFWMGLGLISVPILIHFFFRRRHRIVRWAAMDFLLAALRKQKRRMEIENLILLLLRCAAILLLAVAVARPAWDAPALAFSGGARAVVLVVDTSASMGAVHTGRTSLDRAKERATQFLSELPEGSQVTVVASHEDMAGGGPRAVLENAERGDARAALAGLRAGYGGNRLGAVLALAREKLRGLRGQPLVVLVTDLQRRDWYDTTDTRRTNVYDALRGAGTDEEPPPVVLVDAGQDETANVAVTELAADAGRQAFAGKLVELTATITNLGPSTAHGTLKLQVAPPGDGPWTQVFGEEVTLPPPLGIGAPQPIQRRFSPRVPEKGETSVRFRALFTPQADASDRDRLAVDSERLLAMRVRPPVRILPVRSFTGALELLRDVELVEVIEFLPAIYPQDFASHDLSGVDIVLWADAETASLDVTDVTKLEAFVRGGGGFLAYLGKYADERFSLFTEGRAESLLPMRVGPRREDEEHTLEIERDDEATQAHPLFKETDQPLFFSPDITGYVRVSDYAPESVVAKYTNGDPAVLEKRFGRGRVVVVTTTPDDRYFRLNGSLLPAILFFNATQYLVWEDPRLRNVTVGEPVDIPLPPGTREVEVTPPPAVGGPSREPIADGTASFQLAATPFPGFYRVVARSVAAGAVALPDEIVSDVAVNVEAGEGDLRRVTADELRRAYQGAPLRFADEGEEVLPRAAQGDAGEASRAFLGGVVALLFLELLCAWRFGTRRRATA